MQNQVHIDLTKTEPIKCKCGNETFDQIYFLRRLPGLISPTMKDETIPLPSFICRKCKNVHDFYPKKSA